MCADLSQPRPPSRAGRLARTARRALAPIFALALAAGSPTLPVPLPQEPPAERVADAPEAEGKPAAGLSTLRGKVEAQEGKEIDGARILLYDVATSSLVAERTLGGKGSYAFEDILQGYYRLIVELDGERYLSNRLLLVPPKKKVEANFTLGPVTTADEELGIAAGSTPEGTDEPIAGVARLYERDGEGGLAWFKSGTGYAVLLGGGSALVALLVATSDSDDNPSNFETSPASP